MSLWAAHSLDGPKMKMGCSLVWVSSPPQNRVKIRQLSRENFVRFLQLRFGIHVLLRVTMTEVRGFNNAPPRSPQSQQEF